MIGASGCAQPAANATSSPQAAASASAAASAPPEPPSSAWSRALADVDDDGRFSLDAALRLFAIAYGPLPGMDAPQDRSGVSDGTVAIDAVMSHRDELTTDQLAAVDKALEVPAGTDTVTIPPVGAAAGSATSHIVLAALSKDEQEFLRGSAAHFRERIAGLLGRDFLGDITLVFMNRADPDGADADSWSDWPGGVFGGCRIRLYTAFTAALPQYRDQVLAHEVFHCFQHDAYRTIEAESAVPRWVIEGQAEWAAAFLIDYPNDWWIPYLQQPTTPLTKRSYDAIGFYAHLAESGTDPWTIFDDMWVAGSGNADLFAASGATADAFLDSVASGVMLLPNLGAGWTTGGAGMVDSTWAYHSPGDVALGNGGSLTFTAAMFASDIKVIHATADMLHFTENGHARLADGTTDTTALEDAWYCVQGHTCTSDCPGDGPAVVIRGDLDPRFLLALAGGLTGTTATIEGVKFEPKEPCDSPRPTDDTFCTKYRAYVDWATALGEDADVTQELAAEVARRFDDMYPVAPPQLKDWVALVWKIYATYAGNPEPINVPLTGQVAGIAQLPDALKAMHAYCGIPWPAA
ncbi:MAG TPA: hypothetical protein VHL56_04050 [Candidatus Limnocylindrales bacterium]|nr:hypothetical protein [Candidatus Limnocylindrales bacterium]